MSVPKYLIIINDIKEQINKGVFKPGEKIYSEGELKQKYNVSNTTVVRALQELVRDGMVNRIQGKGTYVSKSILNKEVIFNEYSHFPNNESRSFNSKDKLCDERTEVISINEIRDERIAKKLQISSDQEIIHFERIRYVDDIPWAIQNNYISKDWLMNVDLSNYEKFSSLSERINEICGVNILNEAMKETIKVKFPVSENISGKLQLENSPVYRIERITFVADHTPFEYVDSYVRHNYYFIEIEKKKQ
ncbi:GntR family transcriptional regulator [Cytobacillus sp. Hz8]|uniref:GntR family transcriptional regulator n=1 Tax=Cytobacillus sp. Hz8 TaxID=3347168 RepID=UPI0035DE34C2